ncbi:carbohydrate ABC transporter permease [Kaistia dalseonensis]|uniref:Multiple sugar transport system permease protein n=1 Tax=Kaistia dalseonensis TaxID=410840 RepID=A0ABU0H5I4_9HYPH|nr:carbohydrate ABC transporter permease [Kaistia dalseonensis]MCX5494989.1 carbohydrate ABC transporter permease [Kaistia dalseonensis]MDQ0437570.1 multiple sugar transport system permease protein [Kaistia dalseonensis]
MKRYVLFVVALCFLAIYLFPLYWMYLTAFKPSSETFTYPPTFWPTHPQFNFVQTFIDKKMDVYLWNSMVIAVGTTIIAALIGTGCAYALARVRSLGMDIVLFLVLMMQVLPPSLMATPIFVLFNQVGLIATPRFAVVLAQSAKVLPLFIVLCRTSFMQIPKELEEAARVDGASRLGAFLRIAVPLARNGILVTSVLIFLQSFGEYVYSRSLISQEDLQTATVGLMNFMGPNTTDWNGIMTYAVIYVTPILIVFMLLQRKIVSGLTAGALK